jgi:hypothetical protein
MQGGGVSARRFELHRDVDVSGISGTGVVADGWVHDTALHIRHWHEWHLDLPPGWVRLVWRGEHSSTSLWSNLATMLAIHGHNEMTRVVWLDEEPDDQADDASNDGAAS